MEKFDRLKLLVGDKFDYIKNKRVLIIGLGGVGGYAFEALVRSGIENFIIVDNDTVDVTNLNRQIISTTNNIGKSKVIEAKNRALLINPSVNIKTIDDFITLDNINSLFLDKIDYIVDACDTITVKLELIRISKQKNIKLISSMGTGNKMDPSKFKICDVRNTSYDPIAKIIRKMVKDEKIKGKVMVVSSTEKGIHKNISTIPSNSYIPALSGILCASYVINDIVGDLHV